MSLRFKVQAKARQVLAAQASPESANQPEALPWVLYDTQALATAGAGPLNYFNTVQADKTMGNMEGPGQLPDPQFFENAYWGVDFLEPAVNAAAPAATLSPVADIVNLLFTCRLTWLFSISNKNIGPFPASFMHGSGGATGFGYGNSATTARFEYGNNGIFDGGWCVDKAITIPPKIGFTVTLALGTACTLTTTPLNIRAWMAGVLHRRVL